MQSNCSSESSKASASNLSMHDPKPQNDCRLLTYLMDRHADVMCDPPACKFSRGWRAPARATGLEPAVSGVTGRRKCNRIKVSSSSKFCGDTFGPAPGTLLSNYCSLSLVRPHTGAQHRPAARGPVGLAH